MPSIRSGFGSDFVLKSEKIGIGSETPTNTLDVGGAIKGNLSIAGVATLTSYGGFVAQNQHINKASSIGFGTVGLQTGVGIITSVQYYETETGFTDLGGVHHGDDQYYNTLSEDLVIDEGQILNITSIDMVGVTLIGEYDPHSHQSHVCLGALEEVSVTNHFSVPCGGSNDRKDNPIEGTVRFNDDLNTLEFFNGNEWRQFTYNQGQSGRGLFGGGESPVVANIDSINIQSQGNATNFGNLSVARRIVGGFSSNIRGLWGGGSTPSNSDVIDYVTIVSEGNAIDFGNLTAATDQTAACSSSTRGLVGGGEGPSITNVISYVEISTIGNSLDFGDLSENKRGHSGMASATRGFFCGGNNPGSTTVIDVVTIASKGNAIKFGDRIEDIGGTVSASNSTKGIILDSRRISFVTLASEGNAVYFGDLTTDSGRGSALASQTRVVIAIGTDGVTDPVNNIEYVTIATSGNALDFGDLALARKSSGACSDSHGGLGGF